MSQPGGADPSAGAGFDADTDTMRTSADTIDKVGQQLGRAYEHLTNHGDLPTLDAISRFIGSMSLVAAPAIHGLAATRDPYPQLRERWREALFEYSRAMYGLADSVRVSANEYDRMDHAAADRLGERDVHGS